MRTTKDKDFQKAADKSAKNTVAWMRDQLDALAHARNCNGTTDAGKDCKRGSETRRFKLADGTTGRQQKHDNPEAWHDEDAARTAINESQYGVEVRGGWHFPGQGDEEGATEYRITLSGGGPASRIVGELDAYGQPETAVFQYQDWFKPWTAANTTEEQAETLLEWAQQHYFDE